MRKLPEKSIENTNGGRSVFPGIFLLLAAVSIPARLFLSMDQYRNEVLFSHTALAGIALAFLVFSLPEKYVKKYAFLSCKSFFIPFTLLFLLPLCSVKLLPKVGLDGFFLPYYYLLLPLFSALFAEDFRKILPQVFAWTGVIILLASTVSLQLFPQHYYRILHGLPGNRNWNAAFFLALIPSLLYILYDFFKVKKHFSCGKTLLLLLIPSAAAFYLLFHTASLGSFASMSVLLCFIFLFLLPEKWRKTTFTVLCCTGILAIMIFIFSFEKIEPVLGKAGSMGERIQLIKSSWDAILADLPPAGNFFASIEQTLSSRRTEDYFKVLNPAVRSPHPHNHFLYMILGWGVPGGVILWMFLLVLVPVIKSFFILAEEKGNIKEKLLFLSLVSLLTHAQVDLVMEIWPCGVIALLLLGLCWEKSFRRKEEKQISVPEKTEKRNFLCKYLAFLILLFPLFLAGRQAYILYAKEVLFHSETLEKETRKTLTENIAYIYPAHTSLLYDLMLSALHRKDPQEALFLSDLILKGPVPDYARVHYARGQIFLMLGKIDDSLSEYARDAERFPLAVLPVYNMIRIAERNNRKHLLAPLQKEFSRRISILKITQKEFISILSDPGKELTPWRCVKNSPDAGGNIFANWQKRFIEK